VAYELSPLRDISFFIENGTAASIMIFFWEEKLLKKELVEQLRGEMILEYPGKS